MMARLWKTLTLIPEMPQITCGSLARMNTWFLVITGPDRPTAGTTAR